MKLKSWRFTKDSGPDATSLVIEVFTVQRSVVRVEYSPGNPYSSGAGFELLEGVPLDDDVLWELGADMERRSASEFVPIRAKYFDPKGDGRG